MPGTYSQLLYHVVFSTKHREQSISEAIAPRLYSYIAGIIQSEKGVLYEIGGIEDHVHLYFRGRTDQTLSDLMRVLKSQSSRWVHQEFPDLSQFAWQEGYAAFTVSKSGDSAVRQYIANQVEHHRNYDFKTELLKLLTKHGIDFDNRFVFD